jgi:hypothetical protein
VAGRRQAGQEENAAHDKQHASEDVQHRDAQLDLCGATRRSTQSRSHRDAQLYSCWVLATSTQSIDTLLAYLLCVDLRVAPHLSDV